MRTTRDSLWRGQLTFWQPSRGDGYRFNLDPVLLSGFVEPARHVVDLGAGVGVLGVLLLASGRAERVTAFEVQPELAELAARNARENGLADRLEVVSGDFRPHSPIAADAVVFNPPFFRAGEGRGAPERSRDAARHERHGTLADFVAFGAACAPAGPVAAIVPPERADELASLLAAAGSRRLRRRPILPRDGEPPERWLIAGLAGPGGERDTPVLEPPLVVHGGPGREFTAEVKALLHEV